MGLRIPRRWIKPGPWRNSATSRDYSLRPAESLEARHLLAGVPVITEFLADNSNTILDGNGNSSDWLEIFNAGDAAVDLDGWYLTDDAAELTQWQFPSRQLEPGEFLLVFASGDGVPDASGNLHTNFGLNKDGDYLALVEPDGVSVASEYQLGGVDFPDQVEDISYGIVQDATETVLISASATVDVFVPTSDALGTTWTEADFVPAAGWLSGTTGVGYDTLGGDGGGNGGNDGEVILRVDFNDRSAATATQTGFDSFVAAGNGAQTADVTRSYGDIDVTLSDTSGAGYDDKRQFGPVNSGEFTQGLLLQDFVYSLDQTGTGGIDVTVAGLTAGQTYTVSLWSFDTFSSGTRVSDWTINDTVVASDYTFDGADDPPPPPSNDTYKIKATVAADSQGQLVIQGRRDATSVSSGGTPDLGVYLNALEIIQGDESQPPTEQPPATSILKLDFNDQADGESGIANTEAGYEVMTLGDNGASFDGITVTLSPFGGASLDDRDRAAPTDNAPTFTLDQLYDDFIFANGTFDGAGMEVLIEGLTPNANYQVTLRSYDVGSTGTRSSVWSEEASGTAVVFANYTFNGSSPPATNEDNAIVASLTSSAQGTLLLRGVRQGGTSHGVFLNALELGIPGLGPLIGADLEEQMFAQASSAFARIPFSVPADASLDILTMEMQYDAGFVAYLNGQEVARRNVAGAGAPAFDATATTERSDGQAVTPESINLTAFAHLLKVGSDNVLAIHALNSDSADSDLLVLPSLSFTSVQAGALRYFDTPTPGAANVGGFIGFVDDTQFSRDRGFYESQFTVEITSATPDADIYYTTDGSVPAADNPAATRYTTTVSVATTTTLRAVALKEGYRPSNVDTQTYVFLDDVLVQDPLANPNGLVYPTTWEGPVPADYTLDPEVVSQWDDNDPANEDFGIREALLSIPTMSIVMNHDDLWHPSRGLYPDAERSSARYPGSIEYFDPQTGDTFQYNAGVQIHGGASRDNTRLKKHSFRLIFNPDFGGPGRLNFPLFDNSDFADINTVVMRASFTDAFATRTITGRYSPLDSTYTRDVWMRDSQIAMGNLSADSTFVHLYINGLYWGQYSPAERPDDAFLASHLGGEPEDWDVIKDFNELFKGNKDAWNAMFALADQLPTAADPDAIYWELQGKNPDGTRNSSLPAYLDVDNLIDYMILHLSSGPEDWPHHNWYAGRNRVDPGEGFQFFVWDQEIVLDGRYRDRINVTDAFTPAELYSHLRRNSPEFRQRFADRVQLHMFNDGALTVENNQARWMWRADQVEAAIIGESARWGDAREGENVTVEGGQGTVTIPTMTVDHWRATIEDVRDNQLPLYHELTIQRFKEAGLFPGVNTPEFSQHGGPVPAGFAVTMTAAPSVLTEELVLLTQGADMLAFVPTDGSLETGAGPFWYETDFSPSGWIAGTNGVGFEDNPSSFEDLIGTDVSAAWNAHETSVYGRIEFNLADDFDAAAVEELTLRMKYDDGFVVYLNGQMVASDRAPSPSTWNSNATGSRFNLLSTFFFNFDITEHSSSLRPGTNVLALQGLNRSDTDDDLLVLPELVLTRNVPLDSPPVYFTTNGEDPRLPGGDINNAAARLFSEPYVIDETTQIQARAIANGVWSALTTATFVVTPAGGGVVITELNYNPYAPTESEQLALPGIDNDDFEFIEFTNTNPSQSVNLLGMHFTDAIDFSFAGVTLNPGQRGVIVRNESAFVERYGDEVAILGTYGGGLANGGERIEFVDAAENRIAELEYNDGGLWAERADGIGGTLELIDPLNTTVALSGKHYAWRGSSEFGGTPGTAGAGPVGIVINEVLAHTDAPVSATDSIELFNPTNGAIDISGWWLSDAGGTLEKFVVPLNSVLGPGDYMVFDESDFNPTPATPAPSDFALSGAHGDDVWLVIPNGVGGVDAFVDDVHFGGSLNGVTLGRTASGSLLPQSGATLGCANTHARLGAVVISELHFNPGEPSAAAQAIYPALVEDDLEFVEIFNSTGAPADLSDWRLRGGVDIDFADEQILAPGAALVVISFNPDDLNNEDRLNAFRAHHNIDSSVAIVGGFRGQLSDSGEEVRLLRPDEPPIDEPNFTPHVREDGVLYDDLAPWPASADGSGLSLQRRALIFAGDVATSWSSAAPTPGTVAAPANVTGDFTGDGIVDALDIDVLADATSSGITAFLDLDGNGTADFADVSFLVTNILGTLPGDANLDGVVDGSDFNRWNDNKFPSCAKSWADGDFNGDATVDGADFNMWVAHRFSPAQAANAQVGSDPRLPRQPLPDVAERQTRVIEALFEAFARQSEGVPWPDYSQREIGTDEVNSRGIVSGGQINAGHGRPRQSDFYAHRRFALHANETADSAVDVEGRILDGLLSRWGI